MFERIRRWLLNSERVHIRENRVVELPHLVAILDRFLDDNQDYPLEWDDFISWKNSTPEVEVFRERIAGLEKAFLTGISQERDEAIREAVYIRNLVAAQCGIPAR
jgi:hypothetical protein